MPVHNATRRTHSRVRGGESTRVSTRVRSGENTRVTPRVRGGESTRVVPTRVRGGESVRVRVSGGEGSRPAYNWYMDSGFSRVSGGE